jgi:hypothetical protein
MREEDKKYELTNIYVYSLVYLYLCMWMIFILLRGIKELISMHVDDFYFILGH